MYLSINNLVLVAELWLLQSNSLTFCLDSSGYDIDIWISELVSNILWYFIPGSNCLTTQIISIFQNNVNTFNILQKHFFGVKFLTVLKISGVSIGSFWSKYIDPFISILVKVLTSLFGLTENVTYPCPLVPLFGGRKPLRGSFGARP